MFPRNRYSPESLLAEFIQAPLLGEPGDFFIAINSEFGEIEIRIPASDHETAKSAAKSVLHQIQELDNQVQQSCEQDSGKSNLDSSNFELALGSITIDTNELTLGYFGIQVNTEWDAKFKLVDSQWQKQNF